MKRIILYITLIIVFITLGYIGMTNQPVEYPSSDILGSTFYKYNENTENYEEITITTDSVKYKGELLDLNGCYSYKYQKSTGIFKMDCGRAFRLIEYGNGIIGIDNNTNLYFKDKAASFAKEFQNKFGMTLSEYEFEGNDKLENIKINMETFNELMKSDTLSYVYTRNEICTYECILLSNSVTDLSGSKNVYYIEYEELTEELLNKIKETDNEFLTSTSPKILVIGNDKIEEIITISVKSFDTNIFIGYLDEYTSNKEASNEENY